MFTNIKGLVTRAVRYRDADQILTVVTAERGRITVKARGAMRTKSPLSAACQLYAYTDFTLFENRNSISVNAAEPICLFPGLQTRVEYFALAAYITQVTEQLSDSDAGSEDLLRLTLNCLYALHDRAPEPECVRAAFELRAASIAGYEPEFSVCAVCGNPPADPRLALRDGMVYCAGCAELDAAFLPCAPPVLALLNRFVRFPLQKLLPLQCSRTTAETAAALTEQYLTAHIDNRFSALSYYKGLYYAALDT